MRPKKLALIQSIQVSKFPLRPARYWRSGAARPAYSSTPWPAPARRPARWSWPTTMQTGDGRLRTMTQVLEDVLSYFAPDPPPVPSSFAELCRIVEQVEGVH